MYHPVQTGSHLPRPRTLLSVLDNRVTNRFVRGRGAVLKKWNARLGDHARRWNKDALTACIHPKQAPPYITLTCRDDTGRHAATPHAFDAPLHALARFSVQVLAACEDDLQKFCWHARAFVCMRDATFPACTDVVRRVSSCSGRPASRCASSAQLLRAPRTIWPKQGLTQNRYGGGPGACFSLFFLTLIF